MSYDLWSRLRYVLSPQFDIYEKVAEAVYGYVADIGCGTGFGTHLLTRSAVFVDRFECDEGALNFAARTFTNGKVKFHQGDITKMGGSGAVCDYTPASCGGYEFITMIDVIEHIREDEEAVKNCKRLLSKDGTFICSTPNRLSRYRKSDYHVREYSPDDFAKLLGSVFDNVGLVDFELQPLESKYTNPILAVCN
jgi:2-polyprenyl-3-methyl-5-hydroxy-6-metoxy-1,4-benzoquinol methylase